MKEIKRTLNKWTDIPCSWIGRLNIAKMSFLPNSINRFSAIPIKIPVNCFVNIIKLILGFIWKTKIARIAPMILKNKVEGLTLPNFKTYCNATIINTVRE